jgi:hypothetical protein
MRRGHMGTMELRNHPLMSYGAVPNWPPSWLCIGGQMAAQPVGEIGVLKEVVLSRISDRPRIFLIVKHEGGEYMGCLLFKHDMACCQIFELLRTQIGHTLEEIGGFDLSCLN